MKIPAAGTVVSVGSIGIGVAWYVMSRLLERRMGYILVPDSAPFLWTLLLPAVLGGLGWWFSGRRLTWAILFIVGAIALSIIGAVFGFIVLCQVGVACM